MNRIKWLHLSDIHYNMDNYESEWLRNNLIKTLTDQNEKIDMLIVTGDLLYQFKSSFNEVEIFLKSIINTINISFENVFIVPGNHDFKRSSSRKWLIKGIKNSQSNITDTVASLDEEVINDLIDGQKEFWDFHEKFLGHSDDYKSTHFVNLRENFNIINLNTCLISGTENEEGTLSINMKKLMETLNKIKDDTKPNIAIGHHSLECFISKEQEEIINMFEDFNVDIYLCGHIHKNKCEIYPQGKRYIPSIVCGSNMIDLYATPSFNIGEIDLDSSECKVKYYKWSKNRQWIVDNEVDRKIGKDNTLNFNLDRLKKSGKSEEMLNYVSEPIVANDPKLKEIVDWLTRNNKRVQQMSISIKSNYKEIISFFDYAVILSEGELRRANVKEFMEYILYLDKQGVKYDFLKDGIETILRRDEVLAIIMDQYEWRIQSLFNNEQTVKVLCENLIKFYSSKMKPFCGDYHIYGNCVEHLCKYYEIFENLFEFENDFLDVITYAISKSGDSRDLYYDHNGIEKVRKHISLLEEELILKLLEQFDAKQIYNDDIISRQLIAIIEGYYKEEKNEDLKKKLKFAYVDCKKIEVIVLEMIRGKLNEYYKGYLPVDIDKSENIFERDNIIRTIEERISKENSNNSIKCITTIEKLSEYKIAIKINEKDIYEILKVVYEKGKIVKLICENDEVLNFPYKMNYYSEGIQYNSDDYKKIKFEIDNKIDSVIDEIENNKNIVVESEIEKQNKKPPKIYISYSWDDEVHKNWVITLMNKLRENGIDANMDVSIIQSETVNVNQMMIQNIRDSDFIIIVLTENYAQRANAYIGGVGRETKLIENELADNLKRIILVKRGVGEDKLIIPYYLDGVYYMDFTIDDNFKQSFDELIHMIWGVNRVEIAPIGNKAKLVTKRIKYE
ncbi:MAG: metallophosphoesterase [Clostridium butyricum]|nr:metallophosphoesterase [Clostridium butyricum]